MLTSDEIREKVRELEIISKKFTSQLVSGEYHSAFRGKGMRFKEVREYYPGDDIRFIDWNVSARYAHPFTKVFEEERELSVILLIDISSSTFFSTSQKKKQDLIAEIGAIITFSAIGNNDKVGVLFFDEDIVSTIKSRKGRNHALYITRELITKQGTQKSTNINNALASFNRNNTLRSTVFLISDFMDDQYEQSLKNTAFKHDLIGIRILDKMDISLPDIGLVKVKDLESGKSMWMDTSDALTRNQYHQNFLSKDKYCVQSFKKSGAELVNINTNGDYLKILQQFFKRRKLRR